VISSGSHAGISTVAGHGKENTKVLNAYKKKHASE
jgi:hypothetical protein